MFGTNEQAKNISDQSGAVLQVSEIFYTLQGEGPSAGAPAVFIRLAGCNLKCHFCDTDFDSDTKEMNPEEIMRELMNLSPPNVTPLVVISGGEPMRQNLQPLLKALFDDGYHVEIETAGTIMPMPAMELMVNEVIAGRLRIICSPKTAKVHPIIQRLCHDYKYLVGVGDGALENRIPVMDSQSTGSLQQLFVAPSFNKHLGRAVTVWLQPMEVYYKAWLMPWRAYRDRMVPDHEKTLANHQYATMIALRHGYRVSLQLHKILGLR